MNSQTSVDFTDPLLASLKPGANSLVYQSYKDWLDLLDVPDLETCSGDCLSPLYYQVCRTCYRDYTTEQVPGNCPFCGSISYTWEVEPTGDSNEVTP